MYPSYTVQLTKRLGLTTSLLALSLAFPAAVASAQNDLGKPSFVGEKYSGNATPTPISEAEFLNGGGLGFTAEPGLVTTNSDENQFVDMANNPSAIQHSDDGDLPGLHRPALPANQNPMGGSYRASASSISATGTSASNAGYDQPAVVRPVSAATLTPSDVRVMSLPSSLSASANAPSASPLPDALIDTSNTSGFVSASAQSTGAVTSQVTAGSVPSLTPADYRVNARTASTASSPSRPAAPVLGDDLSLPPAAVGGALPLPEVDLPPQSVVVESSIGTTIGSGTTRVKTNADNDFAFVTERLEKVGVDSQRLMVEIGTGMVARPTYVGSDDTEVMMMPHVEIEYLDRYFVSTDRGIGVTLYDSKSVDVDLFGTWRMGREAEGDIRHFAEREGGIAIGARASTYFGPIKLSVEADLGVTGDIDGLKADLDFGYSQALGNKFTAGVNLGARIADANYINSRFGATRTDYYRSSLGIDEFEPTSAGLVDIHGGLEATYRFNPKLSVNLDMNTSLLLGEAASSPVVDVLGSPTQWDTSLTTRYKF